ESRHLDTCSGQNGATWLVFLIADTLFYSYVYDEQIMQQIDRYYKDVGLLVAYDKVTLSRRKLTLYSYTKRTRENTT
ncbi:MAG: hypothetical protein ACI9J4_000265, partial [Paraglaciecola sp.]